MNNLLIKSFFRSKKVNFLYFSLFLLIFGFLSICSYKYINIEEIINKISNSYENRELYLKLNDNNKILLNLKQDSNIEGIYDYFSSEFYQYNGLNVKINPSVFGINKKILIGRNIKYNSYDEIILPEFFLVDGKKKFTKNLINKRIVLSNGNSSITKNVVGIYKSNGFNDVFIATKLENNNEYIVLVKNQSEVNSVKKEYYSYCDDIYLYNSSLQEELKIYKSLFHLIRKMFFIIYLVNILILIFIINDYIKHFKKNICMMKICGFSNLLILYSIVKSIFIVCFYSYILLLFISYFIIANKNNYINFLFIFSKLSFINLILIFLIPFLFIKKIKNIPLIKMIR